MSRHWLSLDRVRAYSIAMLLAYVGIFVIWGLRTRGFTTDAIGRPGVDFSVFWSASYLAMKVRAANVYDYDMLRPVIAAFGAAQGQGRFFLPWVYPPTFLLFVMPLSLLPFAVSYVFFVGVTAATYIAALVRILRIPGVPRYAVWLPVLAFPGIHETVMLGQNSMLTAGLAGWSLIVLRTRPVLSGVLIGLLSMKPQLVPLLFIALVVDRAWTAFFSAAATATVLMACSIAVLGWETVPAFLESGVAFRGTALEHGEIAWRQCPTVFAMMRQAGSSIAAAYSAQGLCALFATWALVKVWGGPNSAGLRIAAIGTATLLASPYIWYYELTWLGLAIAGLALEGVQRGWMPGERGLLVVAWLLPLVLSMNFPGYLPQVGALVTLLMLIAILRRAWRDGSGMDTCRRQSLTGEEKRAY
jgi:hypothetical protein